MKLLIAFITALLTLLIMPGKKDASLPQSGDQSQKPVLSFGVIADIQYCDCDPAGTRFYRMSTGKLREALASLKKDSAQFIITLGDMIDRDFESYRTVMDIIDSSGFKVYNVTGNHDYSVENRLKRKIPVLPASGKDYYSEIFDNFRFIFLNGNDLSTYATTSKAISKRASEYISYLKDNGEINAIDWNGGISGQQLGWLKQELDDASNKNEKVFIICHFPVFPENIHNLLNYREILSLLAQYDNIVAWFNGHNHAGNYGNFNMIHFVTFKGMVETEDKNSFALVDVYRNKIWINGYGREKSQILAY